MYRTAFRQTDLWREGEGPKDLCHWSSAVPPARAGTSPNSPNPLFFVLPAACTSKRRRTIRNKAAQRHTTFTQVLHGAYMSQANVCL